MKTRVRLSCKSSHEKFSPDGSTLDWIPWHSIEIPFHTNEPIPWPPGILAAKTQSGISCWDLLLAAGNCRVQGYIPLRMWPADDWLIQAYKVWAFWLHWGQPRRTIPAPEPSVALIPVTVAISSWVSSQSPALLVTSWYETRQWN